MEKTVNKYDMLNIVRANLAKMRLGADSWAAGAEALQACAVLEKMLVAEDEARKAEAADKTEEVTENERIPSD